MAQNFDVATGNPLASLLTTGRKGNEPDQTIWVQDSENASAYFRVSVKAESRLTDAESWSVERALGQATRQGQNSVLQLGEGKGIETGKIKKT